MPARRLVILTAAILVSLVALCSTAAAAPVRPTDYSKRSHWLSLPSRITKKVDVFYLYPTAYTRPNASAPIICAVDDAAMMRGAQVAYTRQVTAFAPDANIYAPYYRQADAAARAALPQEEQTKIVAGAPTIDGIAAFDYYIRHYNRGRPYILAGHSLGSNVLANLLAQYMKRHPGVYKRMVAAYVIGYSITPRYLAANPILRFAGGATDTGVIVSWNTEAPTVDGTNPVTLPGGIAINPITWTRKQIEATAAQNPGSIELDPATGGTPVLDANGHIMHVLNLADARVDAARGVVICSSIDPAVPPYYTPGGFPEGVLHPFDYPLYFFSIRANAADRIRQYFRERGTPTDTLVTEPQEGYQRIYRFISLATRRLDMAMYSLSDARTVDALIAAKKRGVAVRVLLNSDPAGGGGRTVNQAAYTELKEHGVKVKWAWPGVLWHQKSIVRDGKAVAVMTCNLYAPYYPVVRDFAVITTNRPTVTGVQATFNADFAHTGRPPASGVAPKGSALVWSPGAERPLVRLIESAASGSTIYAETEQLGSPAIEQALVAAVKRGVVVDLTMTYSPAYVSAMDALVAGGVHLSVYPASASLYLHAKALSVNNESVYVGSANFTTAMTNADRNMGIITSDPAIVHGITATMAGDFAGATPY
jgi:phosphatidylserine/phosphatidylglycerophosphate/cardiolipin synthase-like enzyme